MMEIARHRGSRHFVYASSSSVYGGNDSLPFRVEDRVDHRCRSTPPPRRRTS
jgi:UDP-glucuronate 4-epimerase